MYLLAMMAAFFVTDYIPFLGWIDRLSGLHARLERIFKEMDDFYHEVINEHMDPNRKTLEEEDIIDILLQLKKQRSFSIDLTYDHIKAVFMVWTLFPLHFFNNINVFCSRHHVEHREIDVSITRYFSYATNESDERF